MSALNLLAEAIMKALIKHSKAALLIAPLLLAGCAVSAPFNGAPEGNDAQASVRTNGGQLTVDSIKPADGQYTLRVSRTAQHPSYSECSTAVITSGQEQFQTDVVQRQQYTKSDYNVTYDLTLSNTQMQRLAGNDTLNVQLCNVQYSVSNPQINDLQAKYLAVIKAEPQA
jgi:hypothetical protein